MDKKKLPLYELTVDVNEGFAVNTISIVDNPAVNSKFHLFNEDKKPQYFTADSKIEGEILGLAMRADTPIYRFNKDTGEEYNVFFSKETVKEIAKNFFNKNYQNRINLQHNQELFIDAVAYESIIVDSSKGKFSPTGIDAKDGDWIVGIQLNKEAKHFAAIVQAIQEGKFNGLSVEGFFVEKLAEKFLSQNNADVIASDLEVNLNLFNTDLD